MDPNFAAYSLEIKEFRYRISLPATIYADKTTGPAKMQLSWHIWKKTTPKISTNTKACDAAMDDIRSNTVNDIRSNTPVPTPPLSSLLRLPPEIRNQIYGHVLHGKEHPLFFIESNNNSTQVWRCGPPSAFQKPGPPSLLRVNSLIAEEASQILHEVRELRLAIISQGFPTSNISCYHRFCSLEAFRGVLERIQTLTLVVHVHPGHRVDAPYLELLDWICTVLERRRMPIRQLGMVLTCCYGDWQRPCMKDKYDLVSRFQELCPTFVEHSPWNGKCIWSEVKQTKGRYRTAAVEPGSVAPLGSSPVEVLTHFESIVRQNLARS